MDILKIGMRFIRFYEKNEIKYEIIGKGLNEHYLKLKSDNTLISEMHIDTFNLLYEQGKIEIIA